MDYLCMQWAFLVVILMEREWKEAEKNDNR